MNKQEINLDEILRKMGLISCDVLSKKTESPDLKAKYTDIKKRLGTASPAEIRALSYEIQELKNINKVFK